MQEELGERQREMYLREQLKAIQKELGEDDQSREVDRPPREAHASSTSPGRPAPRSSASWAGSSASGRESMEAQVIRTYLEWVAELPWNTRSDDNLDLNHATRCSTRTITA